MKKQTIVYLLLVALFTLSLGSCSSDQRATEEYHQKASKAKSLYDTEKYGDAIDSMKRLPLYAEAPMPSFAEMYNLGNAYYRKGELGLAILYYERALRIEPRSKEVKHNLSIAQGKTEDRVEYVRSLSSELWHKFCYQLPLGAIYFFSLFFAVLIVAGVLLYFLGARRLYRQWGFYGALCAIVLLLLTFCMLHQWRSDFYNPSEAIVVVGQSVVKSEPHKEAQALLKLNEGTKLLQVKVSGENEEKWAFVSLPDGKEGWVSLEDIQFIYPFQ